ncbi:Presilphiperfolan-8-beta-ol synthase [Rhypophila decipiens]|uniref:Terpene synthase n=1 Tax=Rhypophila decipiens TaxID=261697 RepID=A0AAN6Y5V4_9PEZI|nr:Presilphiperfolan-8-beta-ol synthase [Rhypophila decipiens]
MSSLTTTCTVKQDPETSDLSLPSGSSTATCIRIPDLFSSVMATELRVNPHYFPSIREEGYERIRRLMKKDEKWSAKNQSVELGWLCSTWASTANAEALRTLFDYNHWVFLFDDQFDEGHLKSDPDAALWETKQMTDIMDGRLRVVEEDGMNPIRYLWQTVCDRVKMVSCCAVYSRFKSLHQHYFDGLLLQVEDTKAGHPSTRSVEEYLKFRIRTIGVFPAFPISEYAEGVDIPTHAYNHPSVQEIMRISAEMVILVNDIASFKKDKLMGVDFNIINVLQRTSAKVDDGNLHPKKLTMQQALDRIGEMLEDCYRRWYRALSEMPIWGEKTDYQVLRYVDICRDVALGCLHWSFLTPRYLGETEGQKVKRTRELWLASPGKPDSSPTVRDRDHAEIAGLYADIAFLN